MTTLLNASRTARLAQPTFTAVSKIFVQSVRFHDGRHFTVINGKATNGVPIKSFCDATEGSISEFGILLNPSAPRDGDTIGNADAFVFLSAEQFKAEIAASATQAVKPAQAEPAVDF